MCDGCGRILHGDVDVSQEILKPDPSTGIAPLKLMFMFIGEDNTPMILQVLRYLCVDIFTDILQHGAKSSKLQLDPAEETFSKMVMATSGVPLLYLAGFKETTAEDGSLRISIPELTPEVEARIRATRSHMGLLADQLKTSLLARIGAGRGDDYDVRCAARARALASQHTAFGALHLTLFTLCARRSAR